MSAPLRFIVPMPPNMANGRMHHMVKHRVKVGYWALLDWIVFRSFDHAALLGLAKLAARTKSQSLKADLQRLATVNIHDFEGNPSPLDHPLAVVTVQSRMHVGAAMDEDNAIARHKWVSDWLKSRGFIADDRRTCFRWSGLPEQIVKRDGNYRIELTVTPL